MGIDFHQTPMGRKFYEAQIPQLIRGINRVADNLEKVNLDSKEAHYHELIDNIIEYLLVAENPRTIIKSLLYWGFEREDIMSFQFSEEEIVECEQEMDDWHPGLIFT